MENIKFRQLRADEIEVRIGDRKNGKMSLLLYQDARCGMRILDETVGAYGWACNYRREGESLFCGIAIQTPDGTWLWKWNAGAPSNFEATKGEASDAFKRACVLWGIGRSLYSAPKIKIPESGATHSVSKIEYDENGDICELQIVDWNGKVVYDMNNKVSYGENDNKPNRTRLTEYCKALAEEGEPKPMIRKFYDYYKDKVNGWNRFNPETLWDKWKSNE